MKTVVLSEWYKEGFANDSFRNEESTKTHKAFAIFLIIDCKMITQGN